MTVEVDEDTDYEPDALVNCGKALDPDAIAATNPVIVVEVLSPATAVVDAGGKLAGYFRVPSIRHYLIVHPRRREVIHHERKGDRIETRIVTSGQITMDPPELRSGSRSFTQATDETPWHCQLNGPGPPSQTNHASSDVLLDARLLSPDPEHFGANPAVAGGRHQMPRQPEMTVDHAVRREELLRLGRRLELLHLPLSPPRRPVRILSAIVEVATGPVPDIRHDRPMGCSVAAQAVGDQATRLVLEASQQPLEEALGGFGIAAALDQDVEHHAMLVDCAPEIMQRAVDADEDLVQVPDVTWLRPPFAQPLRELRPEFSAPAADAFVGHNHAPLRQDQLDVAQAETEEVVQPDSMADDLSREAMARIGGGLWHHHFSLPRLQSRRQPR